METTLKELGFTDGEIKVYKALIKLKKSTITKIIKESGVSSSKVYLILDKLINKGLVKYILINKVKEFHLSKPSNLLNYIQKKKTNLASIETQAKKLVSNIDKILKQQQNESASIYRGILGLKTVHLNLLDELKRGEEYVFFAVDKPALKLKEVQLMYKIIQTKKNTKGIIARGIASPELRNIFKKHLPSKKEYKIRYHNLTLNQGITIGKDRIILETAHPNAFAVEIISPQLAKSYKEFFDKIWKIAKP